MNKKVIFSALIVIGAFAEANFNLLHDLGLSDYLINGVKLIGLMVVSFLPSISKLAKDGDIGGGGIKSPPPPPPVTEP